MASEETVVLPSVRVSAEMMRRIEAFHEKLIKRGQSVGLLNVDRPDAVRAILERGLLSVEADA